MIGVGPLVELRVRVLAFSEFIWGFGVYLRVLSQLKENIVNSLGLVLKGLKKSGAIFIEKAE